MTHVYYDSDKIDWSTYFRQQMIGQGPIIGKGNGGPSSSISQGIISEPKIFRGVRYTRGYGTVRNLVGSFGRFLLPIAQNIMASAKEEAIGALGNVAGDLTQGRSFTKAIKQHGTEAASRMGTRLQQCGKGKKRSRASVFPSTLKRRIGGLDPPNKVIKRANILRNLATMDPDNNPEILKSLSRARLAKASKASNLIKKNQKFSRDYLDFN